MLDEGQISLSDIKELQDNSMFDSGVAITKSDSVSLGNTKQNKTTNVSNDELTKMLQTRMNNVSVNLSKAKDENGIIGKLWGGFKNLTGIGASSNKVSDSMKEEVELLKKGDDIKKNFEKLTGEKYSSENLAKFEKGEIKLKSEKALDGYKEGQEMAVDITGDLVSGMSAYLLYTLAIASAPVTGGASIPLGFGLATGTGAVVKSGVKFLDAMTGGRKYDSFGRDIVTGGFSGLLGPLTGGIGGAVGKTSAKVLGLQAVKQVGKETIEEGAKTGIMQGAKSILMNPTGYKYIGESAIKKGIAYGTEMAADGALAGGIDNAFRTAYDGGSADDVLNAAGQGALGGLILSPIIGGAMKYTGSKIGGAESRIRTNYDKAKAASKNIPVVENPDVELAKQFGQIMKEAEAYLASTKTKGSNIIDSASDRLTTLSGDVSSILQNAGDVNVLLKNIADENLKSINKILEDFANGKDVSEEIAKLSKKGISISDVLNEKLGDLSKQLEEQIQYFQRVNEALSPTVKDGAELAQETFGYATDIAQQAITEAKKIPDTSAFKMLGNLPDRASRTYKTLRTEALKLDDAALSAQKKILSGDIEGGLTELRKYYQSVDLFNKKIEEEITSMSSSAARSGLDESAQILAERLNRLTTSDGFNKLSSEQQIQALTENANILFAKFAQTFSSDKSLPKEVTNVLKQFTSNCTVSRNMNQAQVLADELYGTGKYQLIKSFGAGTIGETYLAKNPEGKEVVIKMLKDGVTPEKFKQDREMFTRYINEFVEDATDKEYKLNLINSMFDAWDRELNFGLEAQGAKNMADGAKRYRVAQTLEVGSKDGRNISLVMEKADGVPLDKLLKMIQLYKTNPSEYLTKYAKEIEQYPVLKEPNKWMGDVGVAYQLAQNEQALFVSQSGSRTIHGDPHAGNIFVDFNASTGKPEIVYIDTGNVINRTNAETIKDIGLSMNMMFGNSRGIAESMLEGATLPKGANKNEIADKVAQMLDDRLYKANVNLKNTQYTQTVISDIMKELNIIPDSNNSNLMKATIQRVETARAIRDVCGFNGNDKILNIKELGRAMIQAFKTNPKEAWQTLKPIIKWALQNKDQAMITFFQMIIKNAQVQSA